MKAIMVMFDSLNRNYLSPYGCQWTYTPNFQRLAEKAVTFETCYAGSLPCMPARRELHTGRYNFLHRSWGPLEPFDDSMPEILKENGVYTHLISDHQHYWEDGGCTYHTRYSSWEISRGQEGDPWKNTPEFIRWQNYDAENGHKNSYLSEKYHRQDKVNREFLTKAEQMPQHVTFRNGLEFIERNHHADSWFLQIETFDPHEPFFAEEKYRKLYSDIQEQENDWPSYGNGKENRGYRTHYKNCYAALLSMCDDSLGKILDVMDKYGMWEDTMLIVNTDHGFLLGEHDWWGKNIMPVYEEIARIPLFIYDPRKKVSGVRRKALVQTIDIPATLLDFFHVPIPENMHGKSLRPVIESDEKVRDYALFGFFGAHVNITDGEWVYMKAPEVTEDYEGVKDLYEYTLMPTHMRAMFSQEELSNAVLWEAMPFTKDCPVLKVPAKPRITEATNYGTRLYCLKNDEHEQMPVLDFKEEKRMANALIRLLEENDSPAGIYKRLGFTKGEDTDENTLKCLRKSELEEKIPESLRCFKWEAGAANMFRCVMKMIKTERRSYGLAVLESLIKAKHANTVDCVLMEQWILKIASEDEKEKLLYFACLNSRTD